MRMWHFSSMPSFILMKPAPCSHWTPSPPTQKEVKRRKLTRKDCNLLTNDSKDKKERQSRSRRRCISSAFQEACVKTPISPPPCAQLLTCCQGELRWKYSTLLPSCYI